MNPDRITLERAGLRAVPAIEISDIEGWALSFGRGQVGRMNSVTTFGIVPWDLFETVETVERRYRNRQRPVRFRLTDLDTELDDLLFARGYDRSGEVSVMTTTIEATELDPAATFVNAVTPAWVTDLQSMGEYDELRTAELAESLAGLTLGHTTARIPGAVGLAVADGALCGLFDIAVAPTDRRNGLGRRITRALLGWGHRQECTVAYLQVLVDNGPAHTLYESMGFAEAYRYWYRVRD